MTQHALALRLATIALCCLCASATMGAAVHTSTLPAGVHFDKGQRQYLYLEGESGQKSQTQDKFPDPTDADRTVFSTESLPQDNHAGTMQAYDGTRQLVYGSDNASLKSYCLYWENVTAKLNAGRYAAFVRALPSSDGTQTYTLRIGNSRAAVDADAQPIGPITTQSKSQVQWYRIGQFDLAGTENTFRLEVATNHSAVRFDAILIVPVAPQYGIQAMPPDKSDPTQLPGHNFAADRGLLRLQISDASDVARLHIRLQDETGKTISETSPQIPAGIGSTGIAEIVLPSRGFYRVLAQADYRDGKAVTCQTTAAVLGTPLSDALRSASRLGIWNVHGDTGLIIAAGGRWNRRMTSLRGITREQVAAATTQPVDPAAGDLPLAQIGVYSFGLPLWSMDLPSDYKQKGFGSPFQKPGKWSDLTDIVQTAAKTPIPGGYPRYVEIYNEPEWHWKGTDEDLVKYFAVVAEAITSVEPQTRVLGPSMSSIRLAEFKDRWARYGLLDHLDGVLMHAYVSGTAPEGEFIHNVRDLKYYLKSIGRGNLPLYFTEYGWTSSPGTWATSVDELTQARYCARSLVLLNHEDVAAAVYFCLLFRTGNAGEAGFSVLNQDQTPKPAYMAFANACRWLAGTTPGQLLELTPTTYLLVCRREDRPIAIAWDTQGVRQLILPSLPKHAEDMMGRTVIPGPDGELSISQGPTYMDLPDASLEQLAIDKPMQVRRGGSLQLPWTPAFCPQPLVAKGPALQVPEQTSTGRYMVIGRNTQGLSAIPVEVTPSVRVESVALRWPTSDPLPSLAVGIRSYLEKPDLVDLSARVNGIPDTLDERTTLPAYGAQELRITLPQLVPGQRYKGQLTAQFPGMKASDRDTAPLDLTVAFARKANDTAGPVNWVDVPQADMTAWGPFVANKAAAVGPDDCSARIQAAYGQSGLHLRVQVTDDHQVQDQTPSAMWQGDSLQIGLDMDAGKPWVANAGGYNGHVHVYELGVAMIAGKPKVWRWISYDPDRAANVAVDDVPATVSRTGNLTTYEITFPWSSVGLTQQPQPGSRIGFALVVNDDDPGKPRHGLRLFSGITVPEGPNAKAKDPAAYGTLWMR